MKPCSSLKSILAEFLPLHRTLASDGMDKTLAIIGSYMPDAANYTIENYAPLTPVWTWKVPERYIVHEAYLETEASTEQGRSGGERIVDLKNNPLHIISYSLPIDKILPWDELAPHLRYSEKRPNAIPWEFKFYERSWGFCLSKNRRLRRIGCRHGRNDHRAFVTGGDHPVSLHFPEGAYLKGLVCMKG